MWQKNLSKKLSTSLQQILTMLKRTRTKQKKYSLITDNKNSMATQILFETLWLVIRKMELQSKEMGVLNNFRT